MHKYVSTCLEHFLKMNFDSKHVPAVALAAFDLHILCSVLDATSTAVASRAAFAYQTLLSTLAHTVWESFHFGPTKLFGSSAFVVLAVAFREP